MVNNCLNNSHLFVLELSESLSKRQHDRYLANLSDQELAYWELLKSQKRKQQFLVARFLLCQCFLLKMGSFAKIGRLESGQPYFIGLNLFCSISHSANRIAVCYSSEPIGIDIESHKQRNFDRLVEHYFHSSEQTLYSGLSVSERLPWFYRQWTGKEAIVKASGDGLSFAGLSLPVESLTDSELFYMDGGGYALSCSHHASYPVILHKVRLLDDEPWISFDG